MERWAIRKLANSFAIILPVCVVAWIANAHIGYAQSQLGVLIDQCASGDMTACNMANQLAIRQSQEREARNMPAPNTRMYVYSAAPSICSSRGGNALLGDWRWTHNLFGDIKRNYPQLWPWGGTVLG